MAARRTATRIALVAAALAGVSWASAAFAPIPAGDLSASSAAAAERRPSAALAATAPRWDLAATWQTPAEAPLGGVLDPVDLDIAADGTVFVLDHGLHRAQRFRAQTPEAAYGGGVGLDAGLLASPLGLAADVERGRLLVADTDHGALARFDLASGAATSWSEFGRPESIAIDDAGRAYVYERERNGVSGRALDGEQDLLFPVQRALSFASDLPRGLAVSPAGTVFFAAENPVANSPNVLYEFSAGGDTLPPRTAMPWQIFDIAFDSYARLWLLDGTNARLVGDLDRNRGTSGAGVPVPGGARALAAGDDGLLALLYGATSERAAGVVELVAEGAGARQVAAWEFPPLDAGWLPAPQRVVALADGGEPVIADGTERAVHLGRDRGVRAALARPGLHDALRLDGGDWLVARTRFATTFDPKDDPDVAQPGTRRIRIERYAAAAAAQARPQPLWTWEHVEPVDAFPVTTLTSLVHDAPSGRTYALDAGGGAVIALDAEGALVERQVLPTRSGIPRWVDLVVLADGTLAALHGGARELHPLGDVPAEPIALAVGATPLRLDRDALGRLFVLTADRTVVVLDPGGALVASIALPAPTIGEADAPSDVAVAIDGTVFVTDRAGMAVHVFTSAGAMRSPAYLPQLAR